ncbi:MAG: transposase, IS4 family protein, partial [uncultured Chloroflexia bacterium]
AAIKRSMMQFFPPLTGHRERHFNTLAALICGIIGAECSHLSAIANHAPAGRAGQESLTMRFRRWLVNDSNTIDHWFLPVAKALIDTLAHQPLLLAIDGSTVGRGCIALMVSVVYHGRALPLCWVVVKGKKGHFPQSMHCTLLSMLQPLIPTDAEVVVLGDGEFDGCDLQALMRQFGWQYVVRTGSNVRMHVYGCDYRTGSMAPTPGELLGVRPAWMTAAQFGPVSILALWEQGNDGPLYLVTNMADLNAAFAAYKKRAHIETFFSDLKSRGFGIDKSHLSEPGRLMRLLIAACLAYIWVVYLGVCSLERRWMKCLHLTDRCDLSLFQLGMRLLTRCLKEALPIPKGFLVPLAPPNKPVRRELQRAA